MDARLNITTDDVARRQRAAKDYQSNYFKLAGINLMAADEQQNIDAVLKQLAALETDADATANAERVAADLIKLTMLLPHPAAVRILIHASQNSPLLDKSAAHTLIVNAIKKQSMHQSPLMLGEKTLEYIIAYDKINPQEVKELLTNPELLLMWLNAASALETGKLLRHYFHHESIYFIHMRDAAEKEYINDTCGKAFLCFNFMNPNKPKTERLKYIKKAVDWLNQTEFAGTYERIIRSLRISSFHSMEYIRDAQDAYVSAHKLNAPGEIFDGLSLRGASLAGATLAKSSFVNCDLTGADLTGADLREANLQGANLSQCKLTDTKLEGVSYISRDALFTSVKLKQELDRLYDMLTDHPHEIMLRKAIMQDLIACTHQSAMSDKQAEAILRYAYHHDLFKQHNGMHYLKSGLNTGISIAASTFNSLSSFFSRPERIVVSSAIETDEQIALRTEFEMRSSLQANPPPARPPEPLISPPSQPKL